jgi:hypothetical protein
MYAAQPTSFSDRYIGHDLPRKMDKVELRISNLRNDVCFTTYCFKYYYTFHILLPVRRFLPLLGKQP